MPEVIIGAGLALLVTAGGGVAVASMLDSSTTANARSERRVEVNRALEFMKTEVNRANHLEPSPTLPTDFASNLTEISADIDPSSVKPVLQLSLPGSADPVTYFTATPINGSWKGPQVLYRFGPTFTADGTYVNPGNSANWEPLPVLDRLESFSAPVTGDQVELKPVGRIQKLMGRSELYPISLTVGTRQQEIAATSFDRSGGASGSPSTPFDPPSGDVTVRQASTMQVEFLGGEITCGAGGPVIPTQAQVSLTGGTTQSTGWVTPAGSQTWTVQPNTTLNVKGWATGNSSSGDCEDHSLQFDAKVDQGSQVLTLVDGDTVPVFKPLGDQRPIDAFLRSYIDTSTGKVKLASNQVIFLFELGVTDSSESAYDMQDLVVLATITPTTTTYRCNNGLNGSEECTPGLARPNDEVVRDAAGNVICIPSPGYPCTLARPSLHRSH